MKRSVVIAALAVFLLLVVYLAGETEGRHHRGHHDDHDDHHNGGHHGHRRHHGRHHDDDDDDDHHGRHKYRKHHNGDDDEEENGDDEEAEEEEEEEDLHEEQYDQLEKRLDQLTARLHNLDEELDDRLDPEKKEHALSFEHELQTLEASECEDENHVRCGDETECVFRLFVCDGHEDCRNGADEENCDLPVSVGDRFTGHVVFDRCTQRHPDTITFEITAVKVNEAFPVFPYIRSTLFISVEDDEIEQDVALPTTGYYRYNSHRLVFLPPEDDRLGLVCEFDGHDYDKCVGNIVRESTLDPCAQFIFFRETEDDEENGHDEDEDEEEGDE